ncbi:MFS transporter [Nocardia sp. CY41]|uniref:MFS transporter n=1 Tax=Nocardia sp. CY41 TaxID=2608686 RepID=UPI001359F5F7|nr:MFS transporter [Nocardia sp. CY41]
MGTETIRTNRNFLLLWSGNAVSLIGVHGARIAYPLLVLALTGSPVHAGWIGFAVNAPGMLFPLPAGVVADYGDRRRVLVRCQVVAAAAAAAACVFAIQPDSQWVWVLYVAAFVETSTGVFYGASEFGAARDVVPVAQRPTAMSMLEALQPLAILIGRGTGTALLGIARWLPFAIDAVTSVICLVTLRELRIGTPTPPPRDHVDRGVRALAGRVVAGLRVVWRDPFLRSTTPVIAVSNVVVQITLLQIMVGLQEDGQPVWMVGVVLAATGLVGVPAAWVASRLVGRVATQQVYRTALWSWTALLIPLTFTANPIALSACWGGIGVVGIVNNVALAMYRLERVPDDTLGRATAGVILVTTAGAALGAPIAGYLLRGFGTWGTSVVALALMAASALCGTMIDIHQQREVRTISGLRIQ